MVRASEHPDSGLGSSALPPGTPITLSPAGSPSAVCLAEVLAWWTSPSGLVVTARAVTYPASAEQLDNRSVFVSGRTADDTLVVLEAVARHSPEGAGVLELVSVAALAREHRRASVRAAVGLPVVVSEAKAADRVPGDTGIVGTTLDLSGDGCRVRFDQEVSMPVGTDVVTSIDLGAPERVRVTGVVVRAAADQAEIIVAFGPMRIEDSAAIAATVYGALRG